MKKNITEQSALNVRLVIVIGLALALTMGFVDVTASILLNPEGIPSALLLLSSVVMTAILMFTVYLIIWVLISLILRERSVTLTLSVAVFCGSLFTLLTLIGLFPGFSLRGLFEIGIVMGLALLLSIATYYAWPVIASIPKQDKLAGTFGLALPFMFGEMLVLVLMASAWNTSRLLVVAVGMIGLGLILLVLYRTSRPRVTRILVVFTLLIALSPMVLLIGKISDGADSSAHTETTGHAIKHVILLTIDTLRADFLSCYASDTRPTPNIDSLAKDGVLFSNAISTCSWTLPAFSSIATGLTPSVHMTTQATSSLPDTFKTLAEYLREDGYYTAALGRNSFLMPERDLSQGFIDYNFYPKRKHITMTSIGATVLKAIFPHSFKISVSTKELSDIAIKWLEANHQKESFFWLHYFDPHHPYTPPQEFLPDREPLPSIGTSFFDFGKVRAGLYLNQEERDWVRTLYESEVSYVDHSVGRVLATLKRLKIYDESLIILTSDHGDEFWEHGSIEHGHTLYNELIHVPLIVKLPHSLKASNGIVKQIETTVSTQSILPTVMELCQIEYNKDDVSISPLTSLWEENSQAFNQQPIISTGLKYGEDRISIIFDDFKYIRFLSSKKEELYDLTNDPMEQNSLVAERPDKLDDARSLLKQHTDTAANLRDRFNIGVARELDLPKDVLERLRSLGYIK